jgi:DNA polymerase II small subunit/DNA polymerase delta subunit B
MAIKINIETQVNNEDIETINELDIEEETSIEEIKDFYFQLRKRLREIENIIDTIEEETSIEDTEEDLELDTIEEDTPIKENLF